MNFSKEQVKEIVARIEVLIAEKHMKKKDFYERSGISSSLYSQWNTGAVKPTMKSLGMAAAALGVDVEQLVTGKPRAGVVTDDDIKFALFGGGEEITDEMYEEVKRFAAFVKQRGKQQ